MRSVCILTNFVNFQLKKPNFDQIWQNLHHMTPYFGKFTPKWLNFFQLHTQWPPFFYEILHQMPRFRSLVGTYPSLSYSSAPPRLQHIQMCKWRNALWEAKTMIVWKQRVCGVNMQHVKVCDYLFGVDGLCQINNTRDQNEENFGK